MKGTVKLNLVTLKISKVRPAQFEVCYMFHLMLDYINEEEFKTTYERLESFHEKLQKSLPILGGKK
jgi:hypothetical protein